MSAENDAYYNLVERIEETYAEIDNDIMTNLLETDAEYIALRQEIVQLEKDYSIINCVVEGDGAISLSAEEHKALARYFTLEQQKENIERRQIYFRGHTDAFAYLKRIGAI